jgi:hypothetical protein
LEPDPLSPGPLGIGQTAALRISHRTRTTEAFRTLSGEQPDITRSSSVVSFFETGPDQVTSNRTQTSEAPGLLIDMSDISITVRGDLVGHPSCRTRPAPYALVEWVTMLIVTREGDHRCKIRPSHRALVALVFLREADPDLVLLGGPLAECDRVGDSREDYSHKHRRHGVNVQVVTDPDGWLLWFSPALPGRAHDLTAARIHRIVRICERQGGGLADHGHQAQPPEETYAHREDSQSSPGHGGTGRTPSGPTEVLADFSQGPMQSELHDVNRHGCPHPESATLKKLTARSVFRGGCRGRGAGRLGDGGVFGSWGTGLYTIRPASGPNRISSAGR